MLRHAFAIVARAARSATRSALPSFSRLLSTRALMLPALIAYGLLVDPVSGHGGLPCLWRHCFGVDCPGCGLSRADAFLIRGSLREAIAQNWMIIPVWTVCTHAFVIDVLTFIRIRSSSPWHRSAQPR